MWTLLTFASASDENENHLAYLESNKIKKERLHWVLYMKDLLLVVTCEMKVSGKGLSCTYRHLIDAKKSSSNFQNWWIEVIFFSGSKQSKWMRTFWTKIGTAKLNNAGRVFRVQTRLFPSSKMKRFEFMKLKFQGKHKNVYMHQLEHGN